jgi:hypothetical protein
VFMLIALVMAVFDLRTERTACPVGTGRLIPGHVRSAPRRSAGQPVDSVGERWCPAPKL